MPGRRCLYSFIFTYIAWNNTIHVLVIHSIISIEPCLDSLYCIGDALDNEDNIVLLVHLKRSSTLDFLQGQQHVLYLENMFWKFKTNSVTLPNDLLSIMESKVHFLQGIFWILWRRHNSFSHTTSKFPSKSEFLTPLLIIATGITGKKYTTTGNHRSVLNSGCLSPSFSLGPTIFGM